MDVEDVFPGNAAAETAAWDGDGAGGAETEVVAPDVDELAWSAADTDDDDEPGPQPLWRRVLPTLLAVLAAGAVVVTGSMLLDRIGQTQSSVGATTTTAGSVPAADSSTAPSAPSVGLRVPLVNAPPIQRKTLADVDAAYLQMLDLAGFAAASDPAGQIKTGHMICVAVADGRRSVPDIASFVSETSYNHSISVAQAYKYVYAALDAYCPQYR